MTFCNKIYNISTIFNPLGTQAEILFHCHTLILLYDSCRHISSVHVIILTYISHSGNPDSGNTYTLSYVCQFCTNCK